MIRGKMTKQVVKYLNPICEMLSIFIFPQDKIFCFLSSFETWLKATSYKWFGWLDLAWYNLQSTNVD